MIISSLLICQDALADEIKTEEASREEEVYEEEKEAYEFPEIKPLLSTFAGYRFVGLKGSERSAEYEYLHNSISLGGELRVFSFPHRLHLDLDVKNEKDYLGEASYAFKDIISLKSVNRSLFHNLGNITLRDLNPATPSPGVDIRDAGKEYGVRVGMNNLFLRLKTPDFPSHLYIDGSLIERKGTEQQISMSGSGYFNDIVRKSRERNVDWQTRSVTVGVNSHLGPVELDISHGEKRFEVGGDRVLYESYSAANSAPARGAGTYPYSLVPELRGSSNTIKLHTSYTGGLVAAATLSKMERENSDSGAKADYLIGSGEVIWTPMAKLAFFLKYRHKETDLDNPGTVTLRDAVNPLNSYTYGVRPSISSKADTASLAVRYRPFSFLTLRPEYSYGRIERKNAGLWALPDSTEKHVVSLSADSRIVKSLNLKTQYIHTEINNPAYNTEPDRSDEGRLSLSWTPLQRLSTLLTYSRAHEKRSSLRYLDQAGSAITTPDARDAERDRLFGSASFLLRDDLSLSASYSDMYWRAKQDVVYLFATSPLVNNIDARVPYKEKSHSYALGLNYTPKRCLTIDTGVVRTISNARFSPGSRDLLQPVSAASFSDLRIKETTYSLSGEYEFKGNLVLGTTYRYRTIKDALDNTHDDLENGSAHILLLTISKRW